jgi:hypothetical protein
MLTSEARLALLAISRQFPNGAEVLRHEIETKDAEIERLRAVARAAVDYFGKGCRKAQRDALWAALAAWKEGK